MIRVFVRTDETMPEHEVDLRNIGDTILDFMVYMDLADKDAFIMTKDPDRTYIRARAINYIRVTEERENE